MPTALRILPNTYYDSVFLMGLAGRLGKQPGVRATAVLMATPKNKPALIEFGVHAGSLAGAGASDLALAAKADDIAAAEAALALVDTWLAEAVRPEVETAPRTLEGAIAALPGANVALISVPGEYAAYEARRALDAGLHVMVFSDNVDVADEVSLKRTGAERGLLVMGPDCGTAILGGVGLGFANAVRLGNIGVVGPSGTGIQHVSSLIDAGGGGISHAIGAGSHDLSDEVGGITTLLALDALAADAATEVIVVISKPPQPEALTRVLSWVARCPKPVITCFLGPVTVAPVSEQHVSVRTLAGAAHAALLLAGSETDDTTPSLPPELKHIRAALASSATTLHGLFAGGTFCYEAQQILLERGVPFRSNTPIRPDVALSSDDSTTVLFDLGDDEFTHGRPHPMIDATLRNERIVAAGLDPTVGLLLLDFILGHGAAADPAGEAIPAIRAARSNAEATGRQLAVIAFVCGTDADPQRRAGQITALEAAGVIVAPSSSDAASWAAEVLAVPATATGAAPTTVTHGPDTLAAPIPTGRRPQLPAPSVVALGVGLFTRALEAQRAPVVHVDWTPPAGGDREMLDLLADLL